jgi:hypothetical protein
MSVSLAAIIVIVMAMTGIIGDMMMSGSTTVGSQYTTDLNTLSHWGIVSEEQSFGALEYAAAPVNMFAAFFRLGTYDSTAFSGQWAIIRTILFAPITAAVASAIIWASVSMLSRVFS